MCTKTGNMHGIEAICLKYRRFARFSTTIYLNTISSSQDLTLTNTKTLMSCEGIYIKNATTLLS